MTSRRAPFFLLLFILFSVTICASAGSDEDMDKAYQNAKKGLFWGLSNLKAKKLRQENKLIANDQLVASVKIEKEINGVRISATGFEGTTEVNIISYRTFETLVKEGYVDKNFLPRNDDE